MSSISKVLTESLTKRGIKRVLLTPKNTVAFDDTLLIANKECGCRVMELAGKGSADYFKIKKENDNGAPT